MTEQWSFPYDRASRRANDGALNVNTLTRHAYNCFGVRRILQDLEERGRSWRQNPPGDGLNVRVYMRLAGGSSDLSRQACEVIAEKYAGHPNAEKLRLKLFDYSGLDPRFQECESKRAGAGTEQRQTSG